MRESLEGAKGAPGKLTPYMSPVAAWAFSIGTSIGWGSLIVTGTNYLGQAGPAGSVLGMLVGLCVMVVIAVCYHFMMVHYPNAGGVYAFTRELFGYDHGVLVAWFLALTYIAMFWANATSLPLFARFFMGDLFQFGPHYQLFGYDVFLGEAFLVVAFIALAGFVCKLHKKGVSYAMIAMVAVIIVGLTVCFVGAMGQRDDALFPLSPAFLPDANVLVQVLHISCISSWAFIGFESISHSAEEFDFSPKLTLRILVAALVTITALYGFVTILSITAYPPEYASWMEYIADLGNASGVAAVPAFFAASYYLGDAGVAMLMAVLLCLVFTSLIANIVALSRLLFSLGRDRVLPESLSSVDERGVPARAIAAIVVVSLAIPFLGRTAVGWVVDVTTLGATLIYGFMSACAIRDGRARKIAVERDCGFVGLVIMVAFALYLLVPSVFSAGTMATESYFLFAVWAMLGFVYFRHLLQNDEQRRFGQSIITWLTLLALVLFTSLAWMSQTSEIATTQAIGEVRSYYVEGEGAQVVAGEASDAAAANAGGASSEETFLAGVAGGLDSQIMQSMFLVSGMFMFSLVVMLSNFTIMRRREEESHSRAKTADTIANTDPLTGVKSKNAYVTREAELNALLEAGELSQLAVVVCDVNGLKQVNDTLGHKAGDAYILAASELICKFFKRSPVYRIGGDEFVALLENDDFENRKQILADLNAQSEINRDTGEVVVAVGMSEINPAMDKEVHAAFERADAAMYHRKRALKGGADPR